MESIEVREVLCILEKATVLGAFCVRKIARRHSLSASVHLHRYSGRPRSRTRVSRGAFSAPASLDGISFSAETARVPFRPYSVLLLSHKMNFALRS